MVTRGDGAIFSFCFYTLAVYALTTKLPPLVDIVPVGVVLYDVKWINRLGASSTLLLFVKLSAPGSRPLIVNSLGVVVTRQCVPCPFVAFVILSCP